MNRIVCISTIATLFAASAVAAQERLIYVDPTWAEQPTLGDLNEANPTEGEEGEAGLICVLQDDGALGTCLVESQSADGFGLAARNLTSKYRMAIPDEGLMEPGEAGRWLRFTVAWRHNDVPSWLRRPSGAAMAPYFPERALRRDMSGEASIDCIVDEDGGLHDCEVVSETPENYQFGRAAVEVSQFFRMTTETLSGIPTEGARVVLPIRFHLGGARGGGTSVMRNSIGDDRFGAYYNYEPRF